MRGAMLKSIPWDVWIAIAIVVVDILAAVFEMAPALFIATYVALCGYIVVKTFGDELG
jgi:hypothetical protein